MKKLLPIILVLLGIGGGGAAGVFLEPPPPPPEEGEEGGHGSEQHAETSHGDQPVAPSPSDYVKIGRQTIVPVVEDGETRALMLFELAVDVPAGRRQDVHDMEPRLRDAFLRELFQMSYTGAFMSTFTDDRIIEELRRNLVKAARTHLGEDINDVLILDVMRQEL